MGQLMVIGRTVWGPKVYTLKGTEVSLFCVQCFLYLLQQISLFFLIHGWILSGHTSYTEASHICHLYSLRNTLLSQAVSLKMAPTVGTVAGTYIPGTRVGVRSLWLPKHSSQVTWLSHLFPITSSNNRLAISYFPTSFLPALVCTGSSRIEAKKEKRGKGQKKCYLPDISNLFLVSFGLVCRLKCQ